MMSDNDIASSLLAGNFERRTPDARFLSDPIVDTPMMLTLDELQAYEFNPRLTRNPHYDDIAKSIRQRGLDTPPSVTRRPDQEHYIIHNGGNTRLQILRELWSQTKEERFFRILCIFRPWKSEIVALTGHLAENELHGSLTLIERALGVDKARELYEQSLDKTLSQAELAKQLTQDGYPVGQAQISRMQDTVSVLLPSIPVALYGGLSDAQVRKLLSLRQNASRFWIEHAAGEALAHDFSEMFQEVIAQFDAEPADFDVERLQDELIGQIAKMTGSNYDLVALEMLHGAKRQGKSETVEPESAIETASPPSAREAQIPEDFIKPDLSDVMADAKNHSATFVLRPKTEQDAPLDTPPDDHEALIQAHIVSPTETSERVQTIRNMVTDHADGEANDFAGNVLKAIPVQAGGLYPISDVWYIDPVIDAPEQLRVHIEQLALEIADEAGCKKSIVPCEGSIGFRCHETGQPVLVLLGAISRTPASTNIQGVDLYNHLHELLLGSDAGQRLSDEALVKLFRLIRLARRLIELSSDIKPYEF